MGTYRQIFYQIVFSTKFRKPSLPYEHQDDLYKYICGVIKNKNCQPLQVNGIDDHILHV
jgi:hypothetical protein